ncbi:MAG TPA: hypothetical protein VFY84_20935, partial [Jiangellales bacterium]|nr:hypothetical protein [Jiangellales bacterium]
MTEGRPLHSVFSELLRDDVARQAYAADPGELLGQAGHGELPDDLLAEAIVSFADTAPPEIAEHLAPFVMAHSAVPVHDGEPPSPATGLELLADAPADAADTFGADDLDAVIDGAHSGGDPAAVDSATPLDDLNFGVGARDAGQPADDLLDRPIETPDPMETPPADEFDEGPAEQLPLGQIAPEPDGLDGEDDGLPE